MTRPPTLARRLEPVGRLPDGRILYGDLGPTFLYPGGVPELILRGLRRREP